MKLKIRIIKEDDYPYFREDPNGVEIIVSATQYRDWLGMIARYKRMMKIFTEKYEEVG